MSRITKVSDETASPAAEDLLGAIKTKVGMVPNLYRVLANQPAALSGLLQLNEELGKGAFNAQTREAIALTVAGANSCDYCASAHSAISKSLNVDASEITSRLNGHSSDPKLNAILALSTAIVEKRGFANDADLSSARQAGLNDSDIVETVANVVANIFTNYVNHVAQTEIDFPVVETKAA
ncbi:MAG: alkyl hydroperoxide reductase AhpD [Hyphococcus sp.]|nr:MAG: alkyl hydroperoxide reductase AhpD [Marinicaulis sp.]